MGQLADQLAGHGPEADELRHLRGPCPIAIDATRAEDAEAAGVDSPGSKVKVVGDRQAAEEEHRLVGAPQPPAGP